MLRVKLLSVVAVVGLVFQPAVRGNQLPEKAAPPPAIKAEKDVADDAERRKETFRIVWQTVKDQHFDPTFGGLNWDAVRDEFAPRAAESRSDRELHRLLQEMLNRLGQSHFAIIPPEIIPAVIPEEPESSGESAEEEEDPELPVSDGVRITEQMTHGIGIDVRIINGAVVVTRVEPMSPADRAGLRSGFVLRSVDGYRMRTVLSMLQRASVYQPAVKHQLPTEIVLEYFNGLPGTYARVSYLDARNILRRVSIKREKLKGEMSPPLPSMPSQFVEFESRRLRNGIGYIRFNVFAVPVMDKFCAALSSFADAPGVVLDLRGNRGGLLAMLYGMGGLLATSQIFFGEMKTRGGDILFATIPQRKPYTGQLVVLIDGTSLSASEILASGLQESGRAVVVGEQSAGSTLASVAKELPTGAILQYAFADFISWYGRRIEGNGVKPDVAVKLDRRSLLGGRDPQLEAALSAVTLRPTRAATINTAAAPSPPQPAGEKAEDKTGEKVGASGKAASPSAEVAAVDPLIDRILEKYVQAIGGREAIEKISSRVAQGTINSAFSGIPLAGTVEIIEKSPNKALTLTTFTGMGVMRRGFTGAYGYEQIPLVGFREFREAELEDAKLASDLHWSIKLKQLFPKMELKGKEKIGEAEVNVIEATSASGRIVKFYFAADTGLLLRKDEAYFEDYRKVDGIMLPFVTRNGLTTVTLTKVTHNVEVDDAAFLEQKDCFTR
jgi:carboxyl-terminal processing protease